MRRLLKLGPDTQARIATKRISHPTRPCREYRTPLIADVVTVKLDVREAPAELLDMKAAHRVAARGQRRCQVGADESGAAGNRYPHGGPPGGGPPLSSQCRRNSNVGHGRRATEPRSRAR